MGRNYGARYIREQERNYGPRRSAFWKPTARIPSNDAPPEGFQRAILEWLDESLPPIIKKNIQFTKSDDSQWISLRTNREICDRVREGRIVFYADRVEVVAYDGIVNENKKASVEYAHPQIFEILQLALTKFYNGL